MKRGLPVQTKLELRDDGTGKGAGTFFQTDAKQVLYLWRTPLKKGGAPGKLRTCVTDGQSNIVIRPDMGATVLAAAYPPQMDLVDDPLDPPPTGAEEAHHARCEAAFAERFLEGGH